MAEPKPRPSRTNLNTVATGIDVAWTCRRCDKTGLASSRGEAGRQFDNHTCRS